MTRRSLRTLQLKGPDADALQPHKTRRWRPPLGGSHFAPFSVLATASTRLRAVPAPRRSGLRRSAILRTLSLGNSKRSVQSSRNGSTAGDTVSRIMSVDVESVSVEAIARAKATVVGSSTSVGTLGGATRSGRSFSSLPYEPRVLHRWFHTFANGCKWSNETWARGGPFGASSRG